MVKIGHYVYWDIYGIKNNPSKEAMEKELEKLSKIQKRQMEKSFSITNSDLVQRQNKINILKKALGK